MFKLKSGESVVDRLDGSHIHESVSPFFEEALTRIDSEQREFLIEEVNFGKEIGKTVCVLTDENDKIVFAQRPNRFGLTRFVIGKAPEPCSTVVIILKKTAQGYVLITAFVGGKAEPEPWDLRNFARQNDPFKAENKARKFWNSRALVWGTEPIIPGTETKICPW